MSETDERGAGGSSREEETRTATERRGPGVGPSTGLSPADTIGRYRVLSMVGAGGMGQVYAAYDPKLDRRVAIKLLLQDGTSVGAERLSREARALARISHPNVVTIHEVDEYDGRLAIAMEYVEGETLRHWARRVPATSDQARMRQALDYLIQAGRGLAAAHAEGFVHRDVKPSNVLVGNDGRVRVADFGVAQLAAREPEVLHADSQAEEDSTEPLTAAGKVVGTPAYMAPEQRAGDAVDAKSDQFSFCLTAWEVLVGERPDLGRRQLSPKSQLEVTRDGEQVTLPASLEAVLRKGLSAHPRGRFVNMDALLDRLQTERAALEGQAKRIRWGRPLMGLAAGVVAVGLLGTVGRRAWAQRQCDAESRALDEVWNDDVEATVREHLRSVDVPYASHTAERAPTWLAEFASQWRNDAQTACEVYRVRRERTEAQHDRVAWCLTEHRLRLESMVSTLLDADEDSIRHAVPVAQALQSAPRCLDPESLPEGPGVGAPEKRDEYHAVHELIVEANRELELGDPNRAAELAGTIVKRAEAGPFTRLLLRGMELRQHAFYAAAKPTIGRKTAKEAYDRAVQFADWSYAVRAAVALAQDRGVGPEVANEWLGIAEDAYEQIPNATTSEELALLLGRADVARRGADFDHAIQLSLRALELSEAAGASEVEARASLMSNISGLYVRRGDPTEALVWASRALALRRETFGPDHPGLLFPTVNSAGIYLSLGRDDEAERALLDAVSILDSSPSYGGGVGGAVWTNLGILHRRKGEREAAVQAFKKAGSFDGQSGAENLADLLIELGRLDEAREVLLSARKVHIERGGAAELLGIRSQLGRLEEKRGNFVAAKAYLEEALETRIPDLEQPPREWLIALASAGKLAFRTGDFGEGLRQLEESVAKSDHYPDTQAWLRFELADMLWDLPQDAGRDRGRARTLVEQARDVFATAGAGYKRYLPQTEAWLEEHTL